MEDLIPSPKRQVGDINSTERGSGARYNEDKPHVELIPVRTWLGVWGPGLPPDVYQAITHLAAFQEGNDFAIETAMQHLRYYTADAAAVLDYGRQKYAAWNWAKGMPWSVCFGCALRHAEKIAEGHELDDESRISHRGHLLCNLMFLDHYRRFYPEGDDRPPRNVFHADS